MNPSDMDQIHEIFFRFGLATLLGAILGIDRDLHRKPAGLRVLAMVGLGACGVIMASIMLEHSTEICDSNRVDYDVEYFRDLSTRAGLRILIVRAS